MTHYFTQHPASVGESYFEHMGVAFSFAARLALAGLACAIHAVAPFACMRTGSRIIETLHDEMVVNRRRARG